MRPPAHSPTRRTPAPSGTTASRSVRLRTAARLPPQRARGSSWPPRRGGLGRSWAAAPRRPGQIVRASVASDGVVGSGGNGPASLSADGRFVAFWSPSSNLVTGDTNGKSDVFVRDRQTGQTVRVNLATGGAQANDNSNGPALSADGRFIAFYSLASNLVAGDTNGTLDVFVHDRQTGQTTRVSVASDGTQRNGASSAPVLRAYR